MKKVCIIDYGSGNLHSAAKAFERIAKQTGHEVEVTSDAKALKQASHIVLPGVGAFGDCKAGLAAVDGMIAAMEEEALGKQKPFLGICVGMQLLATTGYEHGEHQGLGWIKGAVKKILVKDLPIPHMGWNNLTLTSTHSLLDGIITGDHAYFVHSYAFEPQDNEAILATTEYGIALPAIIGKNNVLGTQFHPEKSQRTGLKLIENFLKLT